MNIDTSLASAATARATGSNTIDQVGFLKLLTTQLQTQDPFAPMDASAMTSQMQQLSQTTGISEINAQLKTIAATLAANRLGDASGWIGRNALIASDVAYPQATGAVTGQVTLDAAADTVTIDMLDSRGLIVHSESRANVAAGTVPFDWNGPVTGPLKIRVIAKAGGKPVATTTNVWTPVNAVQSPSGAGTQRLVTPNGLITPDAAIALA